MQSVAECPAGGMMEPTAESATDILREGSSIEMKLLLPSLSLAKTLDHDLEERNHAAAKGRKEVCSESFLRKRTHFHKQLGENMSKATT